jgi:hypothetical protein
MEGSGRRLISDTEENNKQLRIVDVTAENRTKYLPNGSQKFQRLSQFVERLIFAQRVKKFHAIYGTRQFFAAFKTPRHLSHF